MKKLTIIALFLCILSVVPASANASVFSDLQLQINQLFAQLEALQSRIENLIETQSQVSQLRTRPARPERPSRTEEPSITVVSPNGGEAWHFGEQHQVLWNTTGNIEEVIMYLRRPTGAMCKINTVPNTGEHTVIFTENQQCQLEGTGTVTAGEYEMVLYGAGGDISDNESAAPHDSSDDSFMLTQ